MAGCVCLLHGKPDRRWNHVQVIILTGSLADFRSRLLEVGRGNLTSDDHDYDGDHDDDE